MRAEEQRARILNRARIQALELVGQARQEFSQEAFERVSQRLSGCRDQQPDYPDLLGRLVDGALEALDSAGAPVVLRADPRDRAHLESLIQDYGPELRIEYDLDSLGGVIAESADGRLTVINTFESRLGRARRSLELTLAAVFEDQPEAQPEPV